MLAIQRNIVSVIGIILIISLPLLPTLIYSVYSFDFNQIEVNNTSSVNEEEEDEKIHTVAELFSESMQINYSKPSVHLPMELRPVFIETHSPPPDLF